MIMIDFDEQTRKLSEAVNERLNQSGAGLCERTYNAALPLLQWLDYLRTSESTGICDEFFDGLRASIIETAGCVTIGLVRPAVFSLRGQLDLVLSWLYFKDHPVEWARVQEVGEGFLMKRALLTYLEDYYVAFKSRFLVLQSARTRREPDPYRLLSAHIHSQSSLVMPSYRQLNTLVGATQRCEECIELQTEVAEYLGDVLLSCFADKWASLPQPIVDSARSRLDPVKEAKVFG